MSTAALETRVELNRTRLETMLKVLDVDGAVRRVRGGWESTGREWTYDEPRYRRVAEARQREQDAMLEYLRTDQCRMLYLRDQLDDPEAQPCGRCDNCGGLQLSTDVSAAAIEEAQARLARPGVPVAPRKMWPTGMDRLGVQLKGKISDGAAEEGRAVARLTDLGYGQALRELFREGPDGVADVPVPVPLVQAVIEVLNDWRPQVDAIVSVESVRRGELVDSLADGLSRYLQAPLLGRWAVVDPDVAPGQGSMNSAQRVAAVGRRFDLHADPGSLEGRSVLLVDDLTNTGWTLTMAARAIRRAGAVAVRPLVLGVSG